MVKNCFYWTSKGSPQNWSWIAKYGKIVLPEDEIYPFDCESNFQESQIEAPPIVQKEQKIILTVSAPVEPTDEVHSVPHQILFHRPTFQEAEEDVQKYCLPNKVNVKAL